MAGSIDTTLTDHIYVQRGTKKMIKGGLEEASGIHTKD